MVLFLFSACDSIKPKSAIVIEVKDKEFPFHLPLVVEQAKQFNPKAKFYVLDTRQRKTGLPQVSCKTFTKTSKLKSQMKRDLVGPRYIIEDNVLVYANLTKARSGTRIHLGPGIKLINGWLHRGELRAKFLDEKKLTSLFWSRISDQAIIPRDDSGKLICSLQLPRNILADYQAKELRMTSSPFISGDSFRAFADHVYDDTPKQFDLSAVKKGDSIFVSADDLALFFSVIHPRLKEPYVLITHNSIKNVPGPFASYLEDDTLHAWFGKNVTLKHPKMRPLPIGLANLFWKHGNVDQIRRVMGHLPETKEHLVYLNLWKVTCPGERELIYKNFEKAPETYVSTKKPYTGFLEDVANSTFVFSPRGTSLDCHRTWEAMLLGSIPVVKRSEIDPVYEDLPILLIDDWAEVTMEKLKRAKALFSAKKFKKEKLYLAYYLDQIREAQKECR